MKKSEIKMGAHYIMNHSSGLIPVRIEHEVERFHQRSNSQGRIIYRVTAHWKALNLRTGRTIERSSPPSRSGGR